MNQLELNQAREAILNLAFSDFELPVQCTEPGCQMLYDFAEPKNKSLCYWHRNQPQECAYVGCTIRERELNHGLCTEHAKGLSVTFSSKSARANSTAILDHMYNVRSPRGPRLSGLSLQPRELTAEEFYQGKEVIKSMSKKQQQMAAKENTPVFPSNRTFRTSEGDPRRICTIVWAILSGNYRIKNDSLQTTRGQNGKQYAS